MADETRAERMGRRTDETAEKRKLRSGTGAYEDYEGGSVGEAIDSLKEESRNIARRNAARAGAYRKTSRRR